MKYENSKYERGAHAAQPIDFDAVEEQYKPNADLENAAGNASAVNYGGGVKKTMRGYVTENGHTYRKNEVSVSTSEAHAGMIRVKKQHSRKKNRAKSRIKTVLAIVLGCIAVASIVVIAINASQVLSMLS